MRCKKIKGIDYLEACLKWEQFCKCHPEFPIALRDALDELYYLRDKVKGIQKGV